MKNTADSPGAAESAAERIIEEDPLKIVVIGNGMVGCRFLSTLVESAGDTNPQITAFGEEPYPAYDRVHLGERLSGTIVNDLLIKPRPWYQQHKIALHTGDPVVKIDRDNQTVVSENGVEVKYDKLVLAMGSSAFVPPIKGNSLPGVFPYRTIGDTEEMLKWATHCKTVSIIGGGLLALEAAKKFAEMGLAVSVIEMGTHLMGRQLDAAGADRLKRWIEKEGIDVQLQRRTTAIEGSQRVERLCFADGSTLSTDMVVVAAGIVPRDALARQSGLEIGQRGGVVVGDNMQTSDASIYAIGEVACHNGMCYGLVGPGYEMAEAATADIFGGVGSFQGSDMSTKLKLAGIEVASIGNFTGDGVDHNTIVIDSPAKGIYKRLVVSEEDGRILGGVLVGDDRDYPMILSQYQNGLGLKDDPMSLIFPGAGDVLELPDTTKICTCENVTKGEIVSCLDNGCGTVDEVKRATRCGTGCGGCLPVTTQLVKAKLAADGVQVDNHLCEHFRLSRSELFAVIFKQKIKTFDELLRKFGVGLGCEICKPTVASILASLWNEPVHRHASLQDTNDAFLANIQKNGSYSVIPRLPGGEITAEALTTLGKIATRYGLYVKITGGQRIAMFGARIEALPHIWKDLVDAGFESGQAYGKSLRTVKSCVGSSWCRFGQQDSTSLAIELENRYRGLRSPHKLKSGVSGCIRECAEARVKDFGLIATDKGWDLYVCGNGGANPKHAQLLASGIDKETVIRYLDRFLMFYVSTADKLTRTAAWLETLDGGIDYLKRVVLDDSLGINAELEARMAAHVASYDCDWQRALKDPAYLKRFRSFVNSHETDERIQFDTVRGQIQPRDAVPTSESAPPTPDSATASDGSLVQKEGAY